MSAPIGERVAVLETKVQTLDDDLAKQAKKIEDLKTAFSAVRDGQFKISVIIALVAFVVGAAINALIKLVADHFHF